MFRPRNNLRRIIFFVFSVGVLVDIVFAGGDLYWRGRRRSVIQSIWQSHGDSHDVGLPTKATLDFPLARVANITDRYVDRLVWRIEPQQHGAQQLNVSAVESSSRHSKNRGNILFTGLNSTVFYVRPTPASPLGIRGGKTSSSTACNIVVLHHHGHEDGPEPDSGGTWWDHYNVTDFLVNLVAKQYSAKAECRGSARPTLHLFVLSMPLFGVNRQEHYEDLFFPGRHDFFKLLERFPGDSSVLRYFLEPVVLTLNWALRHVVPGGVADVLMTGLSGGGWTTTWIAAIDPRVRISFPIAGSIPLDFQHTSWDFEQYPRREAYAHCGYMCLYVLGGMAARGPPGEDVDEPDSDVGGGGPGGGRRMGMLWGLVLPEANRRYSFQVLHEDDPCCFRGRGRHPRIRSYNEEIVSLFSKGPGRSGPRRGGSADSHEDGTMDSRFLTLVTKWNKHEICLLDRIVLEQALQFALDGGSVDEIMHEETRLAGDILWRNGGASAMKTAAALWDNHSVVLEDNDDPVLELPQNQSSVNFGGLWYDVYSGPEMRTPTREHVLHLENFGGIADGKTDNVQAFERAVGTARALTELKGFHSQLRGAAKGRSSQLGVGVELRVGFKNHVDTGPDKNLVGPLFNSSIPTPINELDQQVASSKVFVSSPFNLTSHFSLRIALDTTIQAVDEMDRFPLIAPLPSYGRGRDFPGARRTPFLGGFSIQDVAIISGPLDAGEAPPPPPLLSGPRPAGTIDGSGGRWWADFRQSMHERDGENRPHLFECYDCDGVLLDGVRFQNSPFWTIHPVYSRNFVARFISIVNPTNLTADNKQLFAPNSDGFDPDSSVNVSLVDSTITAGDDAVAIKSGWDCFGRGFPTENVLISNVTVLRARGAGIAIGSEMSGGVRNVTVKNSFFQRVDTGLRVKTALGRGGVVEDVIFKNITVERFDYFGLQVNEFYGENNPSCPASERLIPPIVRKLIFRGLELEAGSCPDNLGPAMVGGDFEGLPSSVPHDISLEDVVVRGPVGGRGNSSYTDWRCSNVVGSSIGRVEPVPCQELRGGPRGGRRETGVADLSERRDGDMVDVVM